jgi:hypothetical protein
VDPSGLEFIAQEVKSRRVLGDVHLTDFRYREVINGFGEWGATLNLSESAFNPFELTEPWKVRLIAHRDGQVAAGLDIWTRERSLGQVAVPLGGKLAGSWLERVLIGGRNGGDLQYNQWEQQHIAANLVTLAQIEWGDGGVEVHAGAQRGGSVYRDKNTWEASDGKPYGEALQDLADLQNGFQFRFETYAPSPGQFAVRLQTGYPYVTDRAPINAELTDDGAGQLTGNIKDLKLQESVAVLGTDSVVWGSGEGFVRLRGRAENLSLANSIPRIARTENRSDVITQSWLNQRASSLLSQSGTAQYAPQLWLAADDPQHPLGSYATGDRVAVNVDPCLQFPYGLYGVWRIMEIEYNPAEFGANVALVIGDRH